MKWKFLLLIVIVLFSEIDLKVRDIIRKNSLGDKCVNGNIIINNQYIISDTVQLRSGHKTSIKRINSNVELENSEDENDEDWNDSKGHFKGHLSVFEAGVNSFARTNYSGYTITNFM